MKYASTLIAVKDMKKSIKFYKDVLGLEVTADFGANVTLTGGISLQTLETWKDFIKVNENDVVFKNNAGELYFEEDNMDDFIKKLESRNDIKYVHKLFEHRWGQRVVRIYDLDSHIIEVGENMKNVVERFIKSGLSIEETAERMDVSADYVKSVLK